MLMPTLAYVLLPSISAIIFGGTVIFSRVRAKTKSFGFKT